MWQISPTLSPTDTADSKQMNSSQILSNKPANQKKYKVQISLQSDFASARHRQGEGGAERRTVSGRADKFSIPANTDTDISTVCRCSCQRHAGGDERPRRAQPGRGRDFLWRWANDVAAATKVINRVTPRPLSEWIWDWLVQLQLLRRPFVSWCCLKSHTGGDWRGEGGEGVGPGEEGAEQLRGSKHNHAERIEAVHSRF